MGILEELGVGNFNFGFGVIGNTLLIAFFAILFAGIVWGVIYLIYRRLSWNQTIKVYGLIGNRPSLKFVTTGKFVPLGKAGDRVLKARKPKGKTLPNPTLQMGKHEWWYWERLDGEWINWTLGDLDKQFKEAGAVYVNADMRLERLAIEKNLRDRLIKEKFWDKYGTIIINVIFILLITISMVIITYQMVKFGKSLSGAMDKADSILGKIDAMERGTPIRPTDTITGFIPILPLLFWKKSKHLNS